MRHTLCPRCDNVLDKNGHCAICGYQVKTLCHHCGHYNIPTAKYCGGCGIGTTFSVRFRKLINKTLNPFQQIRIKRFFAGITFGTLLATFAFSSMGMKYNTSSNDDNDVITENQEFVPIYDETIQNSTIIKSINSDLENFCSEKNITKTVSKDEMTVILDILIRNLNHVAQKINKKRKPLDDAKSYIEKENSLKNEETMTRGTTALLFFSYLSDLFEIKYKDYTKNSTYEDIPRFNIMEVPTTALKEYNIKLSASDNKFGVYEDISLGEICDAAKQIAILTVERANKEAPELSSPPEIIIE